MRRKAGRQVHAPQTGKADNGGTPVAHEPGREEDQIDTNECDTPGAHGIECETKVLPLPVRGMLLLLLLIPTFFFIIILLLLLLLITHVVVVPGLVIGMFDANVGGMNVNEIGPARDHGQEGQDTGQGPGKGNQTPLVRHKITT